MTVFKGFKYFQKNVYYNILNKIKHNEKKYCLMVPNFLTHFINEMCITVLVFLKPWGHSFYSKKTYF